MKKGLVLFFTIILCSPLFLKAQEIPKNANEIYVANNLTAYANFIDAKLLLSKKQIEIAVLDKEAFEIKTALISDKDSLTVYYLLLCRDNYTRIIGWFKNNADSNTSAKDFEIISNRGAAGTKEQLAFTAMNDFAKQLGKKLKYEVAK